MRPTHTIHLTRGALAACIALAAACQDGAPTEVPNAAPPRALAAPRAESLGPGSPRAYYVDPGLAGSDANPGTIAKPFRTLRHAAAVDATGDTVRLAAGQFVHGVAGEQFPITVPAGVTVRGTLAAGGQKRSMLVAGAARPNGLALAGGAAVQDVEIDGFNTGVMASAGAQTVRNVSFVLDKIAVFVDSVAKTTVEDGTIFMNSGDYSARAAYAGGTSTLVFSTGRIDGSAAGCGQAEGFQVEDGAHATIGNVSTPLPITNVGGSALDVSDSATVLMSPVTVKQTLPATCMPWATVRMDGKSAVTLKSSTLESIGGKYAVGIEDMSTGPLVLDGAQVVTYTGIGIRAFGHAHIDLRSSSLLYGNGVGIDAKSMTSTNPLDLTIRESIVYSTSVAVIAPTLTMRGSAVSGHLGVMISGTSPLSAAGPDLGTSASPGGNEFYGAELGVGFWNGKSGIGIVRAAGNTWRKSTQGADALGHYTAGLHVSGTSALAAGANFKMENAFTEIRF